MSETAYPGQDPYQQPQTPASQPAGQAPQPASPQTAPAAQPVTPAQPQRQTRPVQQPAYRPSQAAGAVQRPAATYQPQQAPQAGAGQRSQPQQAAPTRTAYAAAKPSQATALAGKAGGNMWKAILGGFVGAVLGALLVLGATGNLAPSPSGTTATTGDGAAVSQPAIAAVDDDATLAEAVASKTLPSVVCIYVYSEQTSYSWFGPSSTEEALSSLGSGVILSEEGYVLTNYHVIEGESRLKVSVSDTQYDAEVVGTDATSDLAVIKIEGAEGLVPMEIGSSSDLKVGQWVMTVGSPYGMEQSVATGIISAVSRSSSSLQTSDGTAVYANLIQTDAAINPGNSGGALVDAQGKLIGINTLVASYSGSYSGVGFAIPVDYAYSIATQIINGEEPSHAQLGVSLISIDSSTAERYELAADSGAYVAAVSAGAAEAGIQEGDIITKIDGKAMPTATDVILAVRSHMPGDTVNVEVNRNGETLSMDVTLSSDNVG